MMTPLPPLPPRKAGTVMSQLGDPTLRSEEDHCIIPTSYAIDTSLHD